MAHLFSGRVGQPFGILSLGFRRLSQNPSISRAAAHFLKLIPHYSELIINYDRTSYAGQRQNSRENDDVAIAYTNSLRRRTLWMGYLIVGGILWYAGIFSLIFYDYDREGWIGDRWFARRWKI
jgi:hypothetical protein